MPSQPVMEDCQKIAAIVEYCGAAYHGWQTQPHSEPTIQTLVEQALAHVADKAIVVVCAGRTDSRVHAIHQIIHFRAPRQRSLSAWVAGTNRHLPSDIKMRWAGVVDDAFSARGRALSRRYLYVINNSQAPDALLCHRSTWVRQRLDVSAMHQGARYLIGRHDFSVFRSAHCQADSPIKTVHSVAVSSCGSQTVVIDIRADAFLHHMVRKISAALIAIGKGRYPPEWMAELLAVRKHERGVPTAGPGGLILCQVEYPQEYAIPPPDVCRFPLSLLGG